MKKSILILTSIFIFCNTYSQVTKYNWLLGGDGAFSYTNNNSNINASFKTTNFYLAPNIGYFIWDKVCGGLKFSINTFKIKYPPNQSNGFVSYSTLTQFYGIGPFARYYFLDNGKVANIFLETSYQYNLRKDVLPNSTTHQPANIFAFNAGPVIYLNSSVGIELTIGYSSLKYDNATGRNNSILANIGLQFYLEKNE